MTFEKLAALEPCSYNPRSIDPKALERYITLTCMSVNDIILSCKIKSSFVFHAVKNLKLVERVKGEFQSIARKRVLGNRLRSGKCVLTAERGFIVGGENFVRNAVLAPTEKGKSFRVGGLKNFHCRRLGNILMETVHIGKAKMFHMLGCICGLLENLEDRINARNVGDRLRIAENCIGQIDQGNTTEIFQIGFGFA